MSDLSSYRQQVTQYGQRASEAEAAKRYDEAYGHYMAALDVFMYLIKFEKNPSLVKLYKEKMTQYLQRAEYIKKTVLDVPDQPEAGGTAQQQKPKSTPGGGGGGDEDNKEEEKLEGALASAIVAESPNVSWDDVSGLEGAKEGLKEAVVLPVKFPQLFDDVRQPWRGILLYGPPGTGKSFLAKACATECEGTFFSISSSDLVSKWMGESERLIKQLFKMARDKKPSIIFIDEIDSLCGKRTEGENDSTRRIKTEFLIQMQGVGNSMDGVLVLGATNVPWELDQAMRRRFQKRIYISLPDAAARSGILKNKGSKTKNNLTDDDWVTLGNATEGYSGSDMSIVVNEALMMPVRRCQTAKRFRRTPSGGLLPTFPSDPEGQDMNLYDIQSDLLRCPDVSMDDYMTAINRIKPSVCEDDIREHIQWTEDFGQDS
mmetsp:Transcript_16034/g.20290  ORF Transcript_16034/g.20290 Transcript_16034/m.20290 type:complete len:430 (-) Transcript_16034:128-1417(-)|eukprot:CAMPEP_0170461602 /NCGR_PEP_ID=MMETSP0123-20130129/7438_1 /TAXON_ID=182087 /ORGANISM="Favella ehrenbergii, Strain Fehren 1" /LENGTH=429 /DNA_ID=CAMNT_0010726647 /DNA_START=53 /DNA_END=1342 /DNA_ORIENTATION=+